MQRRAFLRSMLTGLALAGAAVLDPDLLTWKPGKTIVTAPAGGWPTTLRAADAQDALRVSRDALLHVDPELVAVDKVTGLSMRFIRSFDVSKHVNRFDVLYGAAMIAPQYLPMSADGPAPQPVVRILG